MTTKVPPKKEKTGRAPKRAKTILEGNPRKMFSKELYGYTRGKLRATRVGVSPSLQRDWISGSGLALQHIRSIARPDPARLNARLGSIEPTS